MNQSLYVIECKGFFKVGISKNPDSRLKQLSAAAPFDLNLVRVFEFDCPNCALIAEEFAHRKLTEMGLFHRPEWFSGKEQEIVEVCETASKHAKKCAEADAMSNAETAIWYLEISLLEKAEGLTGIPAERLEQILKTKEIEAPEALCVLDAYHIPRKKRG